MNEHKLDPALAMTLQAGQRTPAERLPVFVRADVDADDVRARLRDLGISAPQGAKVFAADLSHEEVSRLSDEPWVQAIHLARPARPRSDSD